tara:strand:- start:8388 stop:9206 length:819 start_codon:yes stop_codon:yes gene_type:complete
MKISRIYTVAAYQPIGEWIAARMFSRGERMWMTDEDVANAGCWFVLMLGIVGCFALFAVGGGVVTLDRSNIYGGIMVGAIVVAYGLPVIVWKIVQSRLSLSVANQLTRNYFRTNIEPFTDIDNLPFYRVLGTAAATTIALNSYMAPMSLRDLRDQHGWQLNTKYSVMSALVIAAIIAAFGFVIAYSVNLNVSFAAIFMTSVAYRSASDLIFYCRHRLGVISSDWNRPVINPITGEIDYTKTKVRTPLFLIASRVAFLIAAVLAISQEFAVII